MAQLTLRIGNGIIADIDRDIAGIVRYVTDWDARLPATRQSMERLSWLLDGWTYVCDLWEDTNSDRSIPKRQRINEIMRIIPWFPEARPIPAPGPRRAIPSAGKPASSSRTRIGEPGRSTMRWRRGWAGSMPATRPEPAGKRQRHG